MERPFDSILPVGMGGCSMNPRTPSYLFSPREAKEAYLTDHRDRWLQMSEVDYLGQFVKTWLAFNAWYRSAYAQTTDLDIIKEIKWTNPSPIGSKFRPLLKQQSEEAEQFRTEIGLLYHRLKRYELHTGKGGDKTRISLSQIFIRTEPAIT
jgi:hypothetical protein